MATIITKFSSTASSVPLNTDLVQGELAVNTADKRLFTEDSGATIIELGTNPTSVTTGAITASGNVTVGGNLSVTGNATISGNLTFGDADTDSIALNADVNSNILPNTDDTYDLGSATKEWRNLYIDGTANIDSLVADTADINGGTVDGAIIGGSSAAAGTFTTATATTGNITTLNSTTVDTTNLEVTNLKAKDGTSAGSIADSTGVVTIASSVLTTTDINGGSIDGTTIGSSSASTGNFSTLSIGGTAITATAAELNVLDGITATTAELNYTDGVTSNIQAQLNTKAPIASPTFTGTVTIPTVDINAGAIDNTTIGATTASSGNFSTLSIGGTAITATATELNLLDGVTATTAEINYLDGVTSNIQTQIDALQDSDADLTAIAALTPTDGVFIVGDGSTWVTESGATVRTSLGLTIGTDVAPIASPTFTGTVTADGLVIDTDTLYVDSANNRVGIGTNSPSSDLHIASSLATIRLEDSDIAGGVAYSLITGSSAGNIAFSADPDNVRSSSDIRFNIDGSERMRIDSSGNLLVGTTTTSLATTEGINVGSNGELYVTKDGGSAIFAGRLTSDGDIIYLRRGATKVGSIASVATNKIGFYGSGGTGAVIDSSGNVGIGTGSPTEKLDVTGTVKATNYTDTVYALSGTALDPANGGIQTKTLAANTTFTDSLASGESLVLQLEAGASYTVTWPTIQWVTSSGNVAPTLTAKDTLVFWKVSTTLYGAYTGSYV